jgi:hypothetical protein
LFHYGPFQPLWQQPGVIQCGPQITAEHELANPAALAVPVPRVGALQAALRRRNLLEAGVLVHYSDPFLIRAAGLQGLQQWHGPKLLVCGDLHHGPAPIDTLVGYWQQQFHDVVLLAFNPVLLDEVQRRLPVPVRCLPPGFFRYPRRARAAAPARVLVHVGSLGPHHPQRRALVEALQQRGRVPFAHVTTATAEQAADVYAAHALVLNVPLNNDLNHRFYEVMAAGAPQLVFGRPTLLGPLQELANRPDLIWVDQLEQLEAVATALLNDPALAARPVAPPPEWPMHELLKRALGPAAAAPHTLA